MLLLSPCGRVDAVRGHPNSDVPHKRQERLDGHKEVERWGVVEQVPAVKMSAWAGDTLWALRLLGESSCCSVVPACCLPRGLTLEQKKV